MCVSVQTLINLKPILYKMDHDHLQIQYMSVCRFLSTQDFPQGQFYISVADLQRVVWQVPIYSLTSLSVFWATVYTRVILLSPVFIYYFEVSLGCISMKNLNISCEVTSNQKQIWSMFIWLCSKENWSSLNFMGQIVYIHIHTPIHIYTYRSFFDWKLFFWQTILQTKSS